MTATLDTTDVETDVTTDDAPDEIVVVEETEPTVEEASTRLARLKEEHERLKAEAVAEVAYWRHFENGWCASGALGVLEELGLDRYGTDDVMDFSANILCTVRVSVIPGASRQTLAAAAKQLLLESLTGKDNVTISEVYTEMLRGNHDVLSAQRARERRVIVERWREEDRLRQAVTQPTLRVVPDPTPWQPVALVKDAASGETG